MRLQHLRQEQWHTHYDNTVSHRYCKANDHAMEPSSGWTRPGEGRTRNRGSLRGARLTEYPIALWDYKCSQVAARRHNLN